MFADFTTRICTGYPAVFCPLKMHPMEIIITEKSMMDGCIGRGGDEESRNVPIKENFSDSFRYNSFPNVCANHQVCAGQKNIHP